MPQTDVPHLALPFSFGGPGRHATEVEQDTGDEIEMCAEAVVRTMKGQRIELPRFGIDDPLFRMNGANVDQIRRDVEEWEPRAAVEGEDI